MLLHDDDPHKTSWSFDAQNNELHHVLVTRGMESGGGRHEKRAKNVSTDNM